MVLMSKFGSDERNEKISMRNFKERGENKKMVESERGRGNVRFNMVIEDEREIRVGD